MKNRRLFLGLLLLLPVGLSILLGARWRDVIYRQTGRLEQSGDVLFLRVREDRDRVREPMLWRYSEYPLIITLRHRFTGEGAAWLVDAAGRRTFVRRPLIPAAFERIYPDRNAAPPEPR